MTGGFIPRPKPTTLWGQVRVEVLCFSEIIRLSVLTLWNTGTVASVHGSKVFRVSPVTTLQLQEGLQASPRYTMYIRNRHWSYGVSLDSLTGKSTRYGTLTGIPLCLIIYATRSEERRVGKEGR